MSDWIECTDASGRTYYANPKTGQSSWEKPAELNAASAPLPAPAFDSKVNEAWKKVIDPSTQRPYFYNAQTNETRWDQPEGWVEPVAHVELPPGWVQSIDPSTNRPYYIHSATGKTQWEPPKADNLHRSTASEDAMMLAMKSLLGREATKTPRSQNPASPRSMMQEGKIPARLPPPLKADIEKFKMEGFAAIHFQSVKKRSGLGKKAVPVDEVVQWQKEPIAQSLLASAQQQSSVAVKIFEKILSFMGDAPNKKLPGALARSILDMGIEKPAIRDEMYCQIIKQCTNNPSSVSIVQGWKLMALCVSTFPPSRAFQDFLLAFFAKSYDSPVPEVRAYAPFCFWRVERVLREKSNPDPPELQYIEDLLAKGVPSSMVSFGGTLDYILELQRNEGDDSPVPSIMIQLTNALNRLGAQKAKGIFRVASEKYEVQRLKDQLMQGNYEIKVDNVYVVADLFKIWLRELSDPLIPSSYYQKCIEVADRHNEAVSICSQFPQSHYAALNYLISWLQSLASHASETSMTSDNLAIVFSQNLMRDPSQDSEQSAMMLLNSNKENAFIKNLIDYWPKN